MVATLNDLVDSRNALNRTGREIHQAAKYCSGYYLTAAANGRREAITETMNYATQSLGTMIHHINNLASSFLILLDGCTEKMAETETKLAQVAMGVNIRRERVARKAIGSCTASKVPIKCTRTKIRQDPPMEYVRRPIDYSLLDHIGHGTRSQEPVTSPYGVPVIHAQTLARGGSIAASQLSVFGSTMNPRAMGVKVGREYTVSSATSDYQGGTLGRTAGIYRTGMMGQYGGQQQVLVPMGRNHPFAMSGNPGGVAGGYASNPTSSLGESSRPSSSSSSNQPRAAAGYAPTGVHMDQPQHQGVSFPADYASKQHMFIDQRLPSQEQLPPPSQQLMFMRHHSEPGSVQHNFPAQYHEPPWDSLQRTSDPKNLVPDNLSAALGKIPANLKPHISGGAEGATSTPQVQSSGDGVGGVDLSCLQPSPVDQLRPRQHDDPPWAPHYYIQKAITVYEYVADKADELTFGENELIYVIKKNDDGWWEGVMMNSQVGLFPGNYVEVIN